MAEVVSIEDREAEARGICSVGPAMNMGTPVENVRTVDKLGHVENQEGVGPAGNQDT